MSVSPSFLCCFIFLLVYLKNADNHAVYVGDSATLSFLQLIRMMVESTSGPSSFTMDPQRHRIMENKLSVPKDVRLIHLLPDANMAQVLVESFFVNVCTVWMLVIDY